MKPFGVKSSTYIDSNKEINDKEPKFKVDDIVTISKYKNIFAKGCVPNWSEKELQKTNQKEFRIEKVTKRKGDKLHVT